MLLLDSMVSEKIQVYQWLLSGQLIVFCIDRNT